MSSKPFSQQLISAIDADFLPKPKEEEPVIEIHGALQRITALYERLRTLIDYQEEHFLRRLAIRRILFRRIVIQGKKGQLAGSLLRELIRAGYLENSRYPNSLAGVLDDHLDKYLKGIEVINQRYTPPELIRTQRRLLGIAAAEIEDLIEPANVERTLINRLAAEIADYLGLEEVDDQTHIIAMRTYMKADDELIAWRLWQDIDGKPTNPGWANFLKDPTANVGDVLREALKVDFYVHERELESKVRRFHQLTPPYIVAADLIREHPGRIKTLLLEPAKLEQSIESVIQDRLTRTGQRVQRALFQATLYIFLTKIIIGLSLEIPYDLATMGHVAIVPVLINVFVPPILMIGAGLGIRLPSRANIDALILRTRSLLEDQTPSKFPHLVEGTPRQKLLNGIFSIFYLATYLVSFGGLIWILQFLGFNIMSKLIFLFFLSVVGFFAFRIRNSAKELELQREKEGFLLLIFDFFALPFLRVGRWLSSSIRQVNVVIFVLDFLIEAPLKVFVGAVEDWFTFLREKREELH